MILIPRSFLIYNHKGEKYRRYIRGGISYHIRRGGWSWELVMIYVAWVQALGGSDAEDERGALPEQPAGEAEAEDVDAEGPAVDAEGEHGPPDVYGN
jgi:hypothetical protein